MKLIGEISKEYLISNRMLRYYEQKGILSSKRLDNNYRYYDEIQEMKLRQILLLKKLDFTTTEIELVFSTSSTFEVIKILQQKQRSLSRKIDELKTLEIIINNFIYLLNTTNNPIYDSLSLSLNNPKYQVKGDSIMNKNEVRIITLPKMKVVSFHCMSETPEDDVTKKMLEFVNNHQLSNFRHFGFNNPNPTSDSSVYGYEMWITTDVDYPNETMKEFNGGLYASISTYMSEIGNRWNELAKYVQESEEYEIDFTPSNEFGVASHQWLEECVNFEHFFNPNISFTEKQLDLLLPIKIK